MPEVENTRFEIGSLDFRYLYELVQLCSPEKRETTMYTVKTTGNGYYRAAYFAEIFCNGESIVFLQGDDAAQLIDDKNECTTNEQVQELLSRYNMKY